MEEGIAGENATVKCDGMEVLPPRISSAFNCKLKSGRSSIRERCRKDLLIVISRGLLSISPPSVWSALHGLNSALTKQRALFSG